MPGLVPGPPVFQHRGRERRGWPGQAMTGMEVREDVVIKIWGRNTSSNVQKVMWAVGEMGLPHERIDIGGPFGKNPEAADPAMNPNGRGPHPREEQPPPPPAPKPTLPFLPPHPNT